jgi:2-aminoadipate transaminase
MEYRFARRSDSVEDSFIVEIFKYLQDKAMISFSGGFPNPDSFPVDQLKAASQKVFESNGKEVLQYAQTEGYAPLREFISKRYKQVYDLDIPSDEILITSGSQQALDFIAKTFLDPSDKVLLEEPSYLGAIHTFNSYEADFITVHLNEDGIDLISLKEKLIQNPPKLIYVIPNFQNPSGVSYSEVNRRGFAEIVKQFNVIVIEDDPYGELYFTEKKRTPLKKLLPDQVILMGSFSKTVAPGLRLGWVCAPKPITQKLFTCKEASDLHTSNLDQQLITQFLIDNDYDAHIASIRALYSIKKTQMEKAIETHFPKSVKVYPCEGGMFLWVVLPEGMSSLDLFYEAVKEKVVFVPGDPFYVDRQHTNTLRLNFSNASTKDIDEGIRRLAKVIQNKIQ